MSMVMGGTTCGRIWAGVSEMTSNVLKFHSRKLQDPDKVIEYLQKKNAVAIPKRHNTAQYYAPPSARREGKQNNKQ